MDPKEKLKLILSGMDKEDAALLRELVGKAAGVIKDDTSYEEAAKKFEELKRNLEMLQEKASNAAEAREKMPTCCFCLSNVKHVEHMFKSENNSYHICGECVEECYEKLQDLKKP